MSHLLKTCKSSIHLASHARLSTKNAGIHPLPSISYACCSCLSGKADQRLTVPQRAYLTDYGPACVAPAFMLSAIGKPQLSDDATEHQECHGITIRTAWREAVKGHAGVRHDLLQMRHSRGELQAVQAHTLANIEV